MKIINNDNHQYQIRYQQAGFSALATVIILLLLSGILLSGMNQSVLSWRKNYSYQAKYYQHYNNAISSIEWALTQSWPAPTANWQCKTHPTYHLTACIKQSTLSTGNYTMIKGNADKVQLYHLAQYQSNGSLTVERGHWLDYCPQNRSLDCDD